MPSWKAWTQRPHGLIKWREAQLLLFRESGEVGLDAIIDNQS
jgi:hypothetical protein